MPSLQDFFNIKNIYLFIQFKLKLFINIKNRLNILNLYKKFIG